MGFLEIFEGFLWDLSWVSLNFLMGFLRFLMGLIEILYMFPGDM